MVKTGVKILEADTDFKILKSVILRRFLELNKYNCLINTLKNKQTWYETVLNSIFG